MKAGNPNNFSLEKHYFDFLDDSGNCFIIYQAKLQILFFRINYSALIYSDPGGNITWKSSLKKTEQTDSDVTLSLEADSLKISGRWKRIDQKLPPYLYIDCNNRGLSWNCHHPKTMTEIAFNGKQFRGYGYAETVLMTIKPRNLPMEELRWGHFLSDGFTILWISWKGNHPVNKLYCNSIEYNDSIFDEEKITFGRGTYVLLFNEISIIRKGRLSNVFSKIPLIKIFFNNRILNSIEEKYKAKSVLTINQKISSTGWSLYEIMLWKK
jgi:hypothetical protein